ncbi:hypothetical protein O181_010196 [Austropuccinia psidii MF-1]|uniref:Uncharacterized protein n=1 Tax=Austropuccinia psidii MF-1 TaxID=1389203 RepID=A0A9Q3BTB1_9BASI|nr:hypothetical protein [Austropuccinia psidii MF-1]
MKKPNRHKLTWQIAIQKYRCNMNIVNKAEIIHKNAYGLKRWEVYNTPDNPAYVPLEAEPQIPIDGIIRTDIWNELIEELRASYKQDKNFHVLTSFLDKDFKHTALVHSLGEILKNSYSEEIFHLFDSIIYQRTKHSCIARLCIRFLIKNYSSLMP